MDDDLEAKMKELDEVHKVINFLKNSSENKETQEKAMAAADKILKKREAAETKTVLNKTKITKPADPNAGMMAAMAADAEKRAIERKKREEQANKLKEKGNVALKEGFPAEAEMHYTAALEICKTTPAIWTNRAIVRIRQKKYREAIEDCDWAFRASNDKCHKAMINMGNAHMALGEFEKAEEAFRKCIKLGKKELAQTYLIKLSEKKEQMEQKTARKRQLEELDKLQKTPQNTRRSSEDGIAHRSDYIIDLTKGLLTKSKDLESYLNSLEILELALGRHKHLVYDFIEAGGMEFFKTPDGIIIENRAQERWITLSPADIAKNSSEENACISIIWRLFGITVRYDYPKGEEVMDDSAFPDILLGSLSGGNDQIRTSCLQTIFFFSSIETLRSKLVVVFHRTGNLKKFTDAILNGDGNSISLSMQIITNLTRMGDCRRLFRDDFSNTIQPTLISVLENYESMESETVAKVVSAITNMLKDDFIRRCVVSADIIWTSVCRVLAEAPAKTKDDMDMLANLLGFLHNMSFDKSKVVIENAPKVAKSIERCMIIKSKDDNVLLRCIGLFNNICTKNAKCCSIIINYTEKLVACLSHKRSEISQLAGRCLACMAEKSDDCCLRIVKADVGLKKISKFLESENDAERGNASLLVSKCAPFIQPDPLHLIEPLLKIVNTSSSDHVRKNAAIAVGKLSRDSPEGRKELHRCHGLEILTARLKNVKL